MAVYNQMQFKSISKVMYKKDYFTFIADGQTFATNGINVITLEGSFFIGRIEDVFRLIPNWIIFFKNSLQLSNQQPLKRNYPMVEPNLTRVVQINVTNFGDPNNTILGMEYLVVAGKESTD